VPNADNYQVEGTQDIPFAVVLRLDAGRSGCGVMD
jgi:hypothetical protein